jgi:hypothetical protein
MSKPGSVCVTIKLLSPLARRQGDAHKQRTLHSVRAYQLERRPQWPMRIHPSIASKPCWRSLSGTLSAPTRVRQACSISSRTTSRSTSRNSASPRGKAAFGELATGLLGPLKSIAHYISDFKYVIGADSVVVEGTTHGADREGVEWSGGKTAGGRFCSVFEFRGPLIARMHIYLDPDYTGRDENRFLWGRDRRW